MSEALTLIAQISDLHIKANGRLSYKKVDTQAALLRVIDTLNRLTPRPDMVVITGDLVDFGNAEEYQTLRTALRRLQLPYMLMAGNHDDRQQLRAAFPDHHYLQRGETLNWQARVKGVQLLALDSSVPQQPWGYVDQAQLAWLEEQLAREPQLPTLVMLHHPPLVSGIGHMDKQPLRNPDALAAIIRQHPQVERVLSGHLHRSVQARFAGTLACVAPGVSHQVAFDLSENGPANFVLEPPGFLLHRWHPQQGMTTHQCAIGDYPGPWPFYDANGLID
ncbi:phosphodiesterase [Pantoea sp. EABMAA-21]|uniref:phosphodiesterase n=1 Tax=unclassified Pantoea TaxID=2630326 RepID=UPI000BD755E9|nr:MULTISPECIES: phosphodiesterase [unclassified Pantoea]MDI9276409.1 phosphodiesterase [Pantoea sp. EABMAA-21]SNY70493.1 3',5'-cyclic AMP phosphodiesterase CpdA [Pantoea sp. GL120224-02]